MKMASLKHIVLVLIYYHAFVQAKKGTHQQKKTYIIHMDKSNMPASFEDHLQWYDSSLRSVSNSANMLYTYNNVIHGYSTRLTDQEAESLKTQTGILAVLPEQIYELHTTQTPKFLGLENNEAFYPESNLVSEVIVGVLDT